ncbi:MAG: hypothetical protein A3G38_04655 [Omnitrophica WOR_2 bacterium RIFCSPLOWO2_12_FULL_51_8]|nr:MAG: hypothetical protein A3G38_04655 [Omnitrophica WOR_2 bacterium RIFCSPLOWO2_12_FULL_51_8]
MILKTRSFTYIEVLIALAVVGILFIPMMRLFSHSLYSATVSGDLITAVNLCRWEMERVKNLNLTKAQLAKLGEVWTPALAEPPFTINHSKWRVLRLVKDAGAGPLEVDVLTYRADNLQKPAASLTTLIEDNVWVTREEVQ